MEPEATYQAEAEQDARSFPSPSLLRAEAADIRDDHPGIGWVATMYDGAADQVERLAEALAVAERERDQAREALDEISGLSNVGSPVWEIANAELARGQQS